MLVAVTSGGSRKRASCHFAELLTQPRHLGSWKVMLLMPHSGSTSSELTSIKPFAETVGPVVTREAVQGNQDVCLQVQSFSVTSATGLEDATNQSATLANAAP